MPQAAMIPGTRNFSGRSKYTRSKCPLAAASSWRRRRGMGVLPGQAGTIEIAAANAATATTSTLIAMGAITGPVGAAIAGIIGAAVAIADLFKGCGQTCIAATNIANQAAAIIDQAFFAYMNSPVHYASMQAAYLQLFDGTWAQMVRACSDPSLGAAGQRCISDRQAGSCAYHTSPGGWQQNGGQWVYVAPGANGSGTACWNSFIGRRDPVANDPTVVPDPGSISSPISSAFSSLKINSGFLIPAALVAGGIALFMAGD